MMPMGQYDIVNVNSLLHKIGFRREGLDEAVKEIILRTIEKPRSIKRLVNSDFIIKFY